MTKHREESPLAGHRVPSPPPELEARVTAAARAAAAAELDRWGWVDAVAESRLVRLAWIAMVAGLLLANLALVPPPPSVPVVPMPQLGRTIASRLDLAPAVWTAPASVFYAGGSSVLDGRWSVLAALGLIRTHGAR